jgi:hypothetical protein
MLIRLSEAVMRVSPSDLWQVSSPVQLSGGCTHRHAA